MTGEGRNEKEKLRRLLSLTRRAVQDYDLIHEGDRVCVGLPAKGQSCASDDACCAEAILPETVRAFRCDGRTGLRGDGFFAGQGIL